MLSVDNGRFSLKGKTIDILAEFTEIVNQLRKLNILDKDLYNFVWGISNIDDETIKKAMNDKEDNKVVNVDLSKLFGEENK